ncbi:alpha,alpha-trehalase [Mycobacterium frederiksbergense]|uniref:Alpha,alpha-trehalase n=1 Tax=Mycolicibacterium frederiksbergense TaxID=117567 RepID=A0ABT6KTE6_9MYCO|nr:trehalose-phosphatase [Mycolicibacterium frederiksbergense]MDH6194002.1 alpha,alpha-trehalase [Mycolicibacterium frederiksbergense]
MATNTAVTIDPRTFDAVVFDFDSLVPHADEVCVPESVTDLLRRLAESGVKTAAYSLRSLRGEWGIAQSAGLENVFTVCVDGESDHDQGLEGQPEAVIDEAVRRLGSVPERTAIVVGVESTGNPTGIGLTIAVDAAADSDGTGRPGADFVITDLAQIEVCADYPHRSQLPNALIAYDHLIGVMAGREAVICLDFDGTLSEIVDDPPSATLISGAAEALRRLVALCPVAIISGRDLPDIRQRVGITGLWYAGSHGYQMVGPDGTEHDYERAVASAPIVQQAAAELGDKLEHVGGVLVEHKRFAVAVHYRNVAARDITGVIETVSQYGRDHALRISHGRKLIELRPNLDWNKGAALTWIREKISGSGRGLPVYVGDDTTDEDAFDAVRFSGIGVAVRHEEDGDRPTAAQFILESPAEVVTFLQRLGDRLERENQSSNEAWTYNFEGYDPHSEKLREALCATGNGYFASRASAPESSGGRVHYPGTYAAGIYNRLVDVVNGTELSHESLVNLPNWLPLTFRIEGGAWFDVDRVHLLSYRQILDLRGAVLTRELRFRDDAGRTTSVTQHRFVAMHAAHVAALQTIIIAEDWTGTIQVRSRLDCDVSNCLVERYHGLASDHLTSLHKQVISEDSVLLAVETSQSHIPVALAARTTVWRDTEPATATYRLAEDEFSIGHDVFVEIARGEPLAVEKIVTLVTGRDVAISEPESTAERGLLRQKRFAELENLHRIAWAHLWERLSIELDCRADELRILRLHTLHVLQSVSDNSADVDVGVPARGLHGEAYRGHVFWDELFIFPVLNLRLPMVTRSLLRYRYRRLPEARRAAKLAGYAGAMFPWQSGSDGREESPAFHLNPRSGRWNPDPSHLAHHIGIAVAYNLWQFYQVTGDLSYLIDYGAELLVEIARFWVSRTTYDAERDRYSIRGVIGPDEFHSGYPGRPYQGIDNNAYTNVMAVWVILRAIDAIELMPLPNRIDLREKLGLSTEELARWDHISRRMFVPFHDGVISQFEGYENLTELDWDAYRKRYGNIQRLDRILEAEDDDINRYRAAKQADALMLLFLLSSDELRELLSRLGYRFAPEQIPRTVDYYMGRTSHGSTLSAVVHTWLLARANRDRALDYFQQALKSDVADIQGGTTSEGIHLAAMAGSVDLIQRCFTGLETRGGRLVLSPYWPESLGALGFPIHYRGHHLYIRVSGRGAEISADPRPAPSIVVECRGRVMELASGAKVEFTDQKGSDAGVRTLPPGASTASQTLPCA